MPEVVQRPSARRVHLFAWLVAVTGFALAWIAFQPGYMSYDSLVQYEMSRSLEFTDWHPPIMSALWAVLGSHWIGPGGMLAFQLLLLWAGILTWLARLNWRPAAAWLLIVPFLPWVANFQGVLWKDVGMAYALLLLSALVVAPPTRWRWAASILLVFYALNLRHNAVVAVAPLVFLMFRLQPTRPSVVRASLYAAGVLAACLVAGQLFSQGVLKAEKTGATGYMMLDDLAHLSLHTGESLIPGVSLTEIQRCAATDLGGNRLVGRPMCLYEPEQVLETLAGMPELPRLWREQVAKRPLAYLRFRMATFGFLLRSPASPPYFIWQPGTEVNSFGISAPQNSVSRNLERLVYAASNAAPFLFKPYGWLALSSIGLLLGLALRRTRVQRCASALFASAWLYIAGYSFTTPMADFRYVYWSALACSLAGLLLLIERPGRRNDIKPVVMAGLSAAALACILVIANYERLTSLDTDAMLYASLTETAQETPLEPSGYHDLAVKAGRLSITGPDPYVVATPASQAFSTTPAEFLTFTLICADDTAKPAMQLFTWGGEVKGPSEQHSQRFIAWQGLNVVALRNEGSPAGMHTPLEAVRLDIDAANGCTRFELRELKAMHPSSSPAVKQSAKP